MRDWDRVRVWNWVCAWGVSPRGADTMFRKDVDGPRLTALYMAGYTGDNAEWTKVGIVSPQDLQAVNDACDYLRDTYWIVEEWVRGWVRVRVPESCAAYTTGLQLFDPFIAYLRRFVHVTLAAALCYLKACCSNLQRRDMTRHTDPRTESWSWMK